MAANDEPTVEDVTFVLPVQTYDPDSLLLLDYWAGGEDNGTKYELFRSWSGGAIILEITNPDGTCKTKQAITVKDLVNVWAKTLTKDSGGDWCYVCEKVTTWKGILCSECGSEWGSSKI